MGFIQAIIHEGALYDLRAVVIARNRSGSVGNTREQTGVTRHSFRCHAWNYARLWISHVRRELRILEPEFD